MNLNKLFIIISIFLLIVSNAQADELFTYFESGERSSTDIMEDRESSDDYAYEKTGFKFKDSINDLDYEVTYQYYSKNYDNNDNLDNNWNKISLKFDYKDLTFKTSYKEKLYHSNPAAEYDQTKFDIKYKFTGDIWKLAPSLGINNYNYLSAEYNDQLKFYSALEGYYKFLEEKLKLFGKTRLQEAKFEDKEDRYELITKAGVDYKFDYKYLSLGRFVIESGRDQTLEEEDRDDTYNYDYFRWYLRSEHPINEKLKTALKYERKTRDYDDYSYAYNNYAITNSTTYTFFDNDQEKLTLRGELQHKESSFTLQHSKGYHKEKAGLKLTYQDKDSYKIIAKGGVSKYDYPGSVTSSKFSWRTNLRLEKKLAQEKIILGLEWDHKYDDKEDSADKKQDFGRIDCRFRW